MNHKMGQIIDRTFLFFALASKALLSSVLEKIDNLESFTDRIDYAENHLTHLSSGSSRIVYKTPQNTVIKLAKNKKGLAQNKAESTIETNSKFVNRVFSHSRKYFWIEAPLVEKITEKEFEEISGINFKDFGEALKSSVNNSSSSDDVKKKIKSSKIFQDLTKIAKDNKLAAGDLAKISSYGKLDNKILLIDTGLTNKIYEDFYESS